MVSIINISTGIMIEIMVFMMMIIEKVRCQILQHSREAISDQSLSIIKKQHIQ